MNAAELLPGPPVGYKTLVPDRKVNFLRRVYGRLVVGYTDGVYLVWVADSVDNPVKIISYAVWLYERPAYATQICRRMSLSERQLAAYAGQEVLFMPVIGEERGIVWDRGTVKFASFARAVRHAVVTCTVATDVQFDPIPRLVDLHRQVEERIKPAEPRSAPSPFWRQVAIGLLIAGVVALATLPLWSLVGGAGIGGIIMLVGVLYWLGCSLLPRMKRRSVTQRWFLQGDQKGDIRRGLATLGVQLP